MEAIYPITALQKDPKRVREEAKKGVVRISENGNAAYIFCSEEIFEKRLEQEREKAAYEARVVESIGRGIADIETGHYVDTLRRAFERASKLRASNG